MPAPEKPTNASCSATGCEPQGAPPGDRGVSASRSTLKSVRPIRVILDAQFSGEPSYNALAAMGDAVMEALIDVGATDPFVSADTEARSLLVEVVVAEEVA
jgi:hypothetical protein